MINFFGVNIPDNIYYGIILSVVSSVVIIPTLFLYLKFFKRNTIHIKICKKIGESYKVIKKMKIGAEVKNFKFGDKEFPVQADEGITINNELNIFYDVDSSCALQIQKNKKVNITPELYKTIFEQRLNTLIFDDGSLFGDTMGIIVLVAVIASVGISIYSIIMIGDLSDKLVIIQNALAKLQVIK